MLVRCDSWNFDKKWKKCSKMTICMNVSRFINLAAIFSLDLESQYNVIDWSLYPCQPASPVSSQPFSADFSPLVWLADHHETGRKVVNWHRFPIWQETQAPDKFWIAVVGPSTRAMLHHQHRIQIWLNVCLFVLKNHSHDLATMSLDGTLTNGPRTSARYLH